MRIEVAANDLATTSLDEAFILDYAPIGDCKRLNLLYSQPATAMQSPTNALNTIRPPTKLEIVIERERPVRSI